MRRGQVFALIGIGVLAGGLATAVAVFLPWLPSPPSAEAHRIFDLFWFVTIICIVIFSIVTPALPYAVVRFRARPDDDTDGPPTHGHTGLEIAWTVVPTVLVIAIGVVSAIVLARDDALGKNVLRINVTAQQFAWSFSYPEAKNLTTGNLRVPLGRDILLTFTSKDVIHSFWVPEWAQKQDTVPGIHPTLHITPDKLGRYPVICTELCGLGHATMRTWAIVMTPQAFDKWLKGTGNAQASPTPSVSGAAIFKSNPCGACHTLAAAGTTGKVGPDLDTLKAAAQRAGQPLGAFIRTSITDPNAYVEKGYPKSVMPPFDLPSNQLDALVQYLTESSTKG